MHKEPLYVRERDGQNGWNIVLSAVYAVLFALSVWSLYRVYGFVPQGIPVFDALLLVLAVFRLTRLVVYDKIFRFARELFMDKKVVAGEEGTRLEFFAPRGGFRGTVHDLLSCPWCSGVWLALPVVYAYFRFDWGWYVILVLAIAGTATLVQLLANLIGWKAELGKMQANKLSSEK